MKRGGAKKNAGMELGFIVKAIAKTTFTFSSTFFFLAVILLFFFDIGPGEQVMLTLTVFVTSVTAFGSAVLMRKMHKSDADFKRRREAAAKASGTITMDMWLKKESAGPPGASCACADAQPGSGTTSPTRPMPDGE